MVSICLKTSTMRTFLRNILALKNKEVILTVSSNTLSNVCLDPQHICMVRQTVEIQVNGPDEGPVSFGVDVPLMLSVLSLVKDNADLILANGSNNEVYISANSVSATLAPVDTSAIEDPKIPDFGRTVLVRADVDAGAVLSVLRSIPKMNRRPMCDNVTVCNIGSNLFFHYSVNGSKISTHIPSESKGSRRHVRSIFSVDYLTDIFSRMHGTVSVGMSNNWPMTVSWQYAESATARFYLAPHIEE
ncbi:MAG: hypothetical protein WCR83_07185 [Candidatus Methanomethylophilaceae archaeon]